MHWEEKDIVQIHTSSPFSVMRLEETKEQGRAPGYDDSLDESVGCIRILIAVEVPSLWCLISYGSVRARIPNRYKLIDLVLGSLACSPSRDLLP